MEQREVKFRAHLVNDKVPGSNEQTLWGGPSPSSLAGFWRNVSAWGGTAHIVQWTGLADKRGVPIYEGDVVRGPVGTSHGPAGRTKDWLFDVRFDKSSAGFYLHMDRRNSVYGPGSTYRAIPSWESCEIIGNIYDNPELLK